MANGLFPGERWVEILRTSLSGIYEQEQRRKTAATP
jgi:hypothetical protein